MFETPQYMRHMRQNRVASGRAGLADFVAHMFLSISQSRNATIVKMGAQNRAAQSGWFDLLLNRHAECRQLSWRGGQSRSSAITDIRRHASFSSIERKQDRTKTSDTGAKIA
jgi:hypothetical protein